MTVDNAVDILFDTVQKPNFQTSVESRQLVDDLALSATVKAALVKIAPKIKTAADHGKIHISNLDNETGSKDEAQIKTIAMKVDGVEEVLFEAHVSKEQHNHVNPFYNI